MKLLGWHWMPKKRTLITLFPRAALSFDPVTPGRQWENALLVSGFSLGWQVSGHSRASSLGGPQPILPCLHCPSSPQGAEGLRHHRIRESIAPSGS